jgi:hypothetical protein
MKTNIFDDHPKVWKAENFWRSKEAYLFMYLNRNARYVIFHTKIIGLSL